MAGLLEGRVGLVAGVGPGLGRALAVAFAREGADVVLADRRAAPLDEAAAEVEAQGRRALAVPADITDAEDVERLVARTAASFGRLDTVIANAFSMGPMAPVDRETLPAWRDAFEVNVVGTLRVTLAARDLLTASDGGSVVMVNSQATRRSQPRRGPYSATKAALLSAARTLAGELGPAGIRVNSVVPGHIWGPPLEEFLAQRAERLGTTPQACYDEIASQMPLRRIATAEEVANAAVFLASPLASAITGQSLDVNAGNWFECDHFWRP